VCFSLTVLFEVIAGIVGIVSLRVFLTDSVDYRFSVAAATMQRINRRFE
jgi:hypothetical protein